MLKGVKYRGGLARHYRLASEPVREVLRRMDFIPDLILHKTTRKSWIAVACCFFILAAGGVSRAANEPSLESLIPLSAKRAGVMRMKLPPEVEEIARKVTAATQQNAEWFVQQIRKAKPGEAIPYDTRLGVSAEEWEKYKRMPELATLKEADEIPCEVHVHERLVTFDTHGKVPFLDQTSIDLDRQVAKTPFGETGRAAYSKLNGKGLLGQGEQYALKYEEHPPDSEMPDTAEGMLKVKMRFLSLNVGRRAQDGVCYLNYKMDDKPAGERQRSVEVLLYFK